MKTKLDDEMLDNVVGGIKATINTRANSNAVVRSGPSKQSNQVDSLCNGTSVRTSGESVYNDRDGITWYEIYEPIHGWVEGSIIGL